MAGLQISPPTPTPLQNAYTLAGTAAKQNTSDYSDLMNNYRTLLNGFGSGTNKFNPTTVKYTSSPAVASSISNLGDLSTTGGYTPAQISDIRARAVSPIRASYANALADIGRQRALQGGYSPNYTAARTKMARDESQALSDANTNVNATLAQNIAQNRINTAPSFASAAEAESALRNQIAAENAGILNTGQEFNLQYPLSIAQGMTSLYGTTPALSSTFGNQALNSAQLQAAINQSGAQNNLQLIGYLLNALRG